MPNRSLVYDIGAHEGEDTEFYLKKGFSVVAVEANPELCRILRSRFGEHEKQGKLTILNAAISDKSDEIPFYIDKEKSVWSTANISWVTRNKSLGGGNVKEISIATKTLASVMREYGVPYYCKIDIEGNDFIALKSIQELSDIPNFISIESDKQSWQSLIDEFLMFRALGYSRYQIVDQSLIQLQMCPNQAKEGDYYDHRFSPGSSGLFGDELPSGWLSFAEAVERYRDIFVRYAMNGDNGLFRRSALSLFYVISKIQERIIHCRVAAYVNPTTILPPYAWYDTHAGR